jgi:hypothetical protein|tara:strand:- start:3455 stop:3700 length:246 start_codon:yes stop_codon:yes gene_type:complete
MKYKNIYFDNENQKIRWTEIDPENLVKTYEFIGQSTRVEFDLLIELLWYRYEDSNIDVYDLKKIFNEFRLFCNNIKENFDL